jgi:type III secretion protein Q
MTALVTDPSPAKPSVARPAPLSLHAWRSDDMQFNNLVHAGLGLDFSALEPGTVLELHPCLPSATATAATSSILALEGDAGMLWIEQGAAWVHALTNILLDRGAESAERTWLMSTAAALLPTPWREMFTAIRQSPQAPPDESAHKARLVLRTADHVFTTHGYASLALWQHMFNHTAHCVRRPPAGLNWRNVASQQTVTVARHTLSKARLQALAVGDVVLPQQPLVDALGRGMVSWGAWQLDVQSTVGPELEVIAVYQNNEFQEPADMAEHTPEVQASPETAGLSDTPELAAVPVQLRFELGMLSMTLGEMQSLAAGSILRLQAPAAPPQVRIVAGGQALGHGELVDVDGRLGIQITRWDGA